jgi:hypothetical protein
LGAGIRSDVEVESGIVVKADVAELAGVEIKAGVAIKIDVAVKSGDEIQLVSRHRLISK